MKVNAPTFIPTTARVSAAWIVLKDIILSNNTAFCSANSWYVALSESGPKRSCGAGAWWVLEDCRCF